MEGRGLNLSGSGEGQVSAVMNTVMNPWVTQNVGSLTEWLTEGLLFISFSL
jgi:hypothetical protein